MNRNRQKKIGLFFIDMCVWLVILCVATYMLHVFQRASLVVSFLVLLLIWSFVYQGYRSTFDYFSQLLKISVYLFAFFFLFSIGIGKPLEFITLICCWFVWLVVVALIRFFAGGLRFRPKVLLMPDVKASLFKPNAVFETASLDSSLSLAQFDYLVVDEAGQYETEWRQFVGHCQVIGLNVLGIQHYQELIEGKVSVAHMRDSWMETSFSSGGLYQRLKQLIDWLLVVVTCPISLILMLVVSLMIAIRMGRPVIFSQQRYGQDGKLFNIYKFRTMRQNSADGKETVDNDERITALGKYLRKFRLDELPQLWNVLKGDMSLIGPRPEWEVTASRFNSEIPVYYARHLVKPGITGWAQVKQGHTTGVEGNLEKLQYDLYYIKHFSFLLDIKVVLLTIRSVLFGRGAR